jgi:hypothetical protein
LSLGQIHSALAYYRDHQSQIDRDIERRLAFVNQAQGLAEPSLLVARLKPKGLI